MVSMRGVRLLFSATLGIVTYLLLSIFLGRTGILEYGKLSAYSNRLSVNIDELDKIQQRLSDRVQALQSDPEAIRLLARRLGYFAKGEELLRIDGYNPDRQSVSPGAIVYSTMNDPDRRSLFRAISFAVSVISFLFSMLDGVALKRFREGVVRRVGRLSQGRRSQPI